MYIRYLLKVLFIFIIFLYIYRSEKNILKESEFIIEYLNNFQILIKEKLIKLIKLNFCKENNNNKNRCHDHNYKIRIIERNPLIIYIEKFLLENEIEHLIELAEPLFKPSMVYEDNGTASLNERRTSRSAILKRHHTPIVKCIEKRFAKFQGNIELNRLEPFQLVKYTYNQQFKEHYDWFTNDNQLKNGGQRITTFFTYLKSNCSMCETEFIDVKFNKTLHSRFCDILICDQNSFEYGIRFRPLSGNSIFWFNIDIFGQVDYLTYHAGRPPSINEYKIGLNAWTRERTFLS